MSKLSADGVTKCLGPDKCPVGGNHGGNGTEKSIGRRVSATGGTRASAAP